MEAGQANLLLGNHVAPCGGIFFFVDDAAFPFFCTTIGMRKQLDPRIPTLIRNNVASGHRSFFVVVGDHGRDQVVNLHFLLSQSRVEARPNVLWCYKKDLGFTTHRKKREAKIKRDIKRGAVSYTHLTLPTIYSV